MKVLILDTLLNQASDTNHSKLTRDVITRIHKEYGKLASLEKEGTLSLLAYINRQDGKPMMGVKDIYKYRLSDGDRIIYTHGSDIENIAAEDKDSIVLLAYAKHDDQERTAKKVAPWANPDIEHDYVAVSQFAALANELDVKLDTDEFDVAAQEFLYRYLTDPSSVQSHRILVVPDDEYLDLDPEKQDVSLSESQSKIVQSFNLNPLPTLILGGAGTGKTVICMHILNDFDHSYDGKTGIYFTQSQELLGKVEQKLKYLPQSKNRNDILLYDINDYTLELTDIKRSRLVETRQFLQFINSNEIAEAICKKNGLEPITVWTEIRGTIKGYMGSDWIRVSLMKQTDFSGSIKRLVESNYFERDKEDSRFISLAMPVRKLIERANEDESLDQSDRTNIKKAAEHFVKFDCSIKSITKHQYFNLNEEDSTIEKEKRQAVWDIYLEYDKWLSDNNLIDENDLILKALSLTSESLPECNLIVVDEVQDYTELQIYFLYRLINHCNGKIIFAGDVNQNVNPTYFSQDHLKLLFVDNTGVPQLRMEYLTANFRCSQQIVNVANSISALRRKTVASHGIYSEATETAKREGSIPYRLSYSDSNIRNLIETMMRYPRVALLVPDTNTKNALINVIGKDRYESESIAPFIFTVREIKGMEYAYVICFNLSSYYEPIWNDVLNSNSAKKKTKYRYYFNLLYVAATRAERHLGFVDSSVIKPLEKALGLKEISIFDDVELHFTSLSNTTEEQLKQARQFFDSGHYEEALYIYKRLSQAKDIYRCKLRIAEENHSYEEALKYHILISPWDGYRYIREVPSKSELRFVHDVIYVDSSIKRKSNISVFEVVKKYYSGEELDDIQEIMFDRFKDDLYKGIDKLSTFKFYGGV